jgi:hypothetical protein
MYLKLNACISWREPKYEGILMIWFNYEESLINVKRGRYP